jgi:hypothetical protein
MFIKVLTAAFALLVAVFVVRQIVLRFEREKARVGADARKRAAAGRIPTLEQDPKTGVYRPRD